MAGSVLSVSEKSPKSAKQTNLIASGATRRDNRENRPTLKASNKNAAVRPFQGRCNVFITFVGILPTLLNSWLSATKPNFSVTLLNDTAQNYQLFTTIYRKLALISSRTSEPGQSSGLVSIFKGLSLVWSSS